MSKSLSWIKLNIKSMLGHASFYLMAFMLFISLRLLNEIAENASEDVRVLIYCENSSIGEEIAGNLISDPYMGYSFELAKSREELMYEVRNGYADCAVVFNEKFDKSIAKGKLRKSTEFYQYAGSSSGYIVREVIYPFIMQKVSNTIITDYARKQSNDLIDDNTLKLITGVNDKFNDETKLNIFEMVTLKGSNKDAIRNGAGTGIILSVILVMVITILSFIESERENKRYYMALPPKEVRLRKVESFSVRLILNSMLILAISVIL